MADLVETETYEAGIYQLETTDPVEGGEGGIDNLQAQQLANRTKWIRARFNGGGTGLAAGVVSSSLTSVGILASPHMTGAVIDSGGLTVTAGTTAVQAFTATTGTFTSVVRVTGGTTNPSAAATAVQLYMAGDGSTPRISLVDTTAPSGSRIIEWLNVAGTLRARRVDDAYSGATTYMDIASGGAVTFAGAVAGITTLAVSSTSSFAGNVTVGQNAALRVTPIGGVTRAVLGDSSVAYCWFDVDSVGSRFAGGVRIGAAGNAVTGTLIVDSGLTVSAGTTALQALTATTGSFTGVVTLTSAGQVIDAGGATANARYINMTNTGGSLNIGLESSAGASRFVGSSAYATVFGSTGTTATEVASNGVIRLAISSAGAFDFKANALSGITTLATSSTATIGTAGGAVTALVAQGANANASIAKFARGASEKPVYIAAAQNAEGVLACEGELWFNTGVAADTPFGSGTTSLKLTTTTAVFSGTISSGTINSQTISSAASFTGSLTVASGFTVSAGTSAVQALTATTGVFSGAVSAVGLSSSSGFTVSSGTSAVQALTATTGVFSGAVTGATFKSGSGTMSLTFNNTFQTLTTLASGGLYLFWLECPTAGAGVGAVLLANRSSGQGISVQTLITSFFNMTVQWSGNNLQIRVDNDGGATRDVPWGYARIG